MSEKEMLIKMLNYTKDISLLKYKRLQKLAVLYLYEEDPYYKEKAHKKLRKFVYNIYLSCLSKESRSEISNTGVLINEACYNLEESVNYERTEAPKGADCQFYVTKKKGQWHVAFDGAYRFEKKDDKYIITDSIPREYKKGFYLNDEASKNEIEFYSRYQNGLDIISNLMDRKQELTTYAYQTKNPFIPIEFVELMTDYLELCRIPEEEKNNKK